MHIHFVPMMHGMYLVSNCRGQLEGARRGEGRHALVARCPHSDLVLCSSGLEYILGTWSTTGVLIFLPSAVVEMYAIKEVKYW